MTEQSTSVLVAGGGPVGLSMALMLDHLGVDCVVVERKPTTSQVNKARGIYERSVELYRQLGLDTRLFELLAERGWTPTGKVRPLGFLESLSGGRLGGSVPRPDHDHSPYSGLLPIPQPVLEAALFDAAAERPGIRMLFDTTVTAFEQDSDGVAVRTSSNGLQQDWRARYLVGADGVNSTVRERLGIAMEGDPVVAINLNEHWKADFSQHPQIIWPGGMVVTRDPDLPAVSMVSREPDGTYTSTFLSLLGAGDRERPWDDAGAVRAIRAQVGADDLEVDLIGHESYRLSNQIAHHFRSGRAFLVGDAAHAIPASGGFGLNTGLQDVHNLGWKLAHVLRHGAPDRLLDTYETERRPIARDNGDWSVENAPRFMTPTRDTPVPAIGAAVRSGNPEWVAFVLDDLTNHWHNVGRALGYTYEIGAMVADGTAKPVFDSKIYIPRDRPGGRLPHIWLDNTHTHSTLDWVDRDFVLIVGPQGDGWLDAGRIVSHETGIPLDLHVLPRAYPTEGFHLGEHGALLVRPDGHVAWRRAWLDDDPVDQLRKALTTVLR